MKTVGKNTPARKRYHRYPFRTGHLVEVNLDKIFKNCGYETARFLYVIKSVGPQGVCKVEADTREIPGVTMDDRCMEYPFDLKTLYLKQDQLDTLFFRRESVGASETYHAGDEVQISWRLDETCPFAWWDATVLKVDERRGVYVKHACTVPGFETRAWYTLDMVRKN